jgi:hypothetical protein
MGRAMGRCRRCSMGSELFEIKGGTHAASIGEAYRVAMLWLFGPSER